MMLLWSSPFILRLVRCVVLYLTLAPLSHVGAAMQTLQKAEVLTPADISLPVTLPHSWDEGLRGFNGVAEYRLKFTAPLGNDLLGVYVPRACSTLEVFVNGHLVGSRDRMEPPYPRNCYYPSIFPLPRSLLSTDSNDLRVRVAGHAFGESSSLQRSSGLSAVLVGSLAELQPKYDSQYFWNITVAQIVCTSLLGFGFALLGLWLARPRDRTILYLALFAVGWAALTMRLFARISFGSHWFMEAFLAWAFFPVVSCALLFLVSLVGLRWRWMEWGLAVQTVMIGLVLSVTPRDQILQVAVNLYTLGAVECLVCMCVFLVMAWRTQRVNFWLVGAVLVQSIFLLGLEVAQQHQLLPLPEMTLAHFTIPAVFAVIAVRLVQLFLRALSQAEMLNRELEQRVVAKSQEIERNWQELAELRTLQATQDERRRIASDLHDDLGALLLTIVQVSQRSGGPDRIAGMARQALEEMRLSVRSMTGHAMLAEDALADWRAEAVTRLNEAGMHAEWLAEDPPPGMTLPARIQVQVTRILREAVSNAIRHSGGTRCAVRIRCEPDLLHLEVQDNGQGLAPALSLHRGYGLPNIERRVRHLGGEYRFAVPPGGGTLLIARMPLTFAPVAQQAP